jgi:hypothetical protein
MLNLHATAGIRKPVRTGSGISRKVVQSETIGPAVRAAPRPRRPERDNAVRRLAAATPSREVADDPWGVPGEALRLEVDRIGPWSSSASGIASVPRRRDSPAFAGRAWHPTTSEASGAGASRTCSG